MELKRPAVSGMPALHKLAHPRAQLANAHHLSTPIRARIETPSLTDVRDARSCHRVTSSSPSGRLQYRYKFTITGNTCKQIMVHGNELPRGDAYATIVVYDGPHACSAAALGRVLSAIDPSRRRAALVYNVSRKTRAVLTGDGLWELHIMQPPFVLPQSVLWPLRPPLWGFQAQLWGLPFRRVLFFDADHLPLLDVKPERLTHLWEHLKVPVKSIGALSEGPGSHGCFNSGLMLLRPRPSTLAAIELEAERLKVNSSRMSYGARLAQLQSRCPTGWNLDQPLLNSVFGPTMWVEMKKYWRYANSYSVLSEGTCHVSTTAALAEHFDSFHFMHPVRPWEQSNECALFGAGCAVRTSSVDADWSARAQNCTVWGAIAAAWWLPFMRLTGKTRALCRPRVRPLDERSPFVDWRSF